MQIMNIVNNLNTEWEQTKIMWEQTGANEEQTIGPNFERIGVTGGADP